MNVKFDFQNLEGLPSWLEEALCKLSASSADLFRRDEIEEQVDLTWDADRGLSLRCQGFKSEFLISWTESSFVHRLKTTGRKQPLAQAVKAKPGLVVWDLTTGLGRDAMTLASLGCKVVAVEEVPAIFLLLSQAKQNATMHSLTLIRESAQRVELRFGRAQSLLARSLKKVECMSEGPPDVIYLDPMYPAEKRKALPQFELQVLSVLTDQRSATDEAILDLIEMGKKWAKQSVVLKRPVQAAVLGKPKRQVKSKMVRFDIYQP